MDIFLLYLFTRLDALSSVFSAIVVLSGVAAVIFTMVYFIALDDHGTGNDFVLGLRKTAKTTIVATIIAGILLVVVPRQKDVVFIVAGKVGIELAQTTEVKETTAKVYTLLQKKLDEQLGTE